MITDLNDPIEWSKKLVKGRIAESIFEQMLRDTDRFTILNFGYENVLPELMHRQRDIPEQETMEVIRRAPDFVVIDNDTHEVYLIEVKYMMHPKAEWILRDALRMFQSWRPSYLFLATPDGFFFDKASIIKDGEGRISKFTQLDISEEHQTKYIELLNQFIVPGAK